MKHLNNTQFYRTIIMQFQPGDISHICTLNSKGSLHGVYLTFNISEYMCAQAKVSSIFKQHESHEANCFQLDVKAKFSHSYDGRVSATAIKHGILIAYLSKWYSNIISREFNFGFLRGVNTGDTLITLIKVVIHRSLYIVKVHNTDNEFLTTLLFFINITKVVGIVKEVNFKIHAYGNEYGKTYAKIQLSLKP